MICCIKPKINQIDYQIIKRVDQTYVVYVWTSDHYKILCITKSMAACEAILEKYRKDPGAFSFRRFN